MYLILFFFSVCVQRVLGCLANLLLLPSLDTVSSFSWKTGRFCGPEGTKRITCNLTELKDSGIFFFYYGLNI